MAEPLPPAPLPKDEQQRLMLLVEGLIERAHAVRVQFGCHLQIAETAQVLAVAASNLGFAVADWLQASDQAAARRLMDTAAGGSAWQLRK